MSVKKFLSGFSVFDLVIMAIMAALATATKPVIVPLVHIITGPLYIPGGAVAGGFYMMWLVLGAYIVGKNGAATIISIVQVIMIVSLGIYGTHGIVSFITYIAPGLSVDIIMFLFRKNRRSSSACFFAGIAANITGSFLVNLVFFKLPVIPLLLTLSAAALSGGLGGIISWSVGNKIKKTGIGSISG